MLAYFAFLRLTTAADDAAALAFIFVGDEGAADLDLPRYLSVDKERRRVSPRGLRVGDSGTGGIGMWCPASAV